MRNLTVIFAALMLAWVDARAKDALCDRPPYGATSDEYAAAQLSLQDIANAIAENPGSHFGSLALAFRKRGPDWYMHNTIPEALADACSAKFRSNADVRQEYKQLAIDDKQVETLPTTTLAIRYFHSLGYPRNPEIDVFCRPGGAEAIWTTRVDCDSRAAAREAAQSLAYHQQQTQAQRAAEQEQQRHPGVTLVYALFQCVNSNDYATCSRQGEARVTSMGVVPDWLFETLAECQNSARQITHSRPTPEGHFPLGNVIWYECRSKRIDTWEPAQ